MNLPFTAAQFFDVFAHYNTGVWPAQYVLAALGLAVAVAMLVNVRASAVVMPIVAFFWLWMGLVYFAAFFVAINPAARIFATFFVIEALLLIWSSVMTIAPPAPSVPQRITAAILFTYAFVAYPLLGYYSGQRYPESITFGLPCPTVIFTFGVLCLLGETLPPIVLLVPVLWAVIGSLAALQLGVLQDFGLAVAAAVTLLLALPRRTVPRWKEAT